jgi:chromatin remodeling complex protein RSC6
MDTFISAVAQLKASEDTKYDVLYVNTPWNKLSVEQMGKIDLSALTKDEALMYMWADTYTIQSSMELLRLQGFKFESVYQICDVATYPAQESKLSKPAPEGGKASVAKMMVDGAPPTTPVDAENPETPETSAEVAAAKTTGKRAKKVRCPPLAVPKYWKDIKPKGSTRATTEFLLLGRKGGRDVVDKLMNDKAGTLPFQVVRKPDLGKKSRSVPKKNINLDPEWVCDRPEDFLDTVMTHLKPSVKILEVFGSTLKKATDSIGPNVPGGFCPGYGNNTGLANCLNKVMRSMKKVQLQSLYSSLTKMAQADDKDTRVKEFKTVQPIWTEIVKSLTDMKSPVSYDWSSTEPDLPAEWLRLVVLSFAQKNMADFGDLRRKRKKRKTNKDSPRACHGIAKPVVVSKELTDFLGLEEGHMVSRTHTVKLLNNYVKANGLQNPAKKIEIVPDAPMLKLLNPPADFGPITYFKMCSLLGPHFPKETQEVKDARAKEANAAKEAKAKTKAAVEKNDAPVAKKARVTS